ncbi:methylated-DNA--[protein]-cysteine S-methyltransferase [Aliidiomarina sanyensis]|uniref:Methylated-DNA--protein-cysteine methyltransferase n=1 Tax=Aliidiomarina sanyensis TaxID=1249555 RepID=A0A432WI83_9GAMM|nr:methylated-DNA--[protein]-cysteine S-methyltransferase [Aliidiomarina sanyensis]RUO33514.1 cysteine methyltransferase [Aliidiomarina sanyensis]
MEHTYIMASPIGDLELMANDEHILAVSFVAPSVPNAAPISAPTLGVLAQLKEELEAYFAGTLERFSVPLAPQGTVFQQEVWTVLKDIPYGETMSYRELAQAVGRPKGYQAVGQANGRNPIGILIPCHRVINADGGLGGYAGGIERKAWLLRHELRKVSGF